MRIKIYIWGLACILLISCGEKFSSPTQPKPPRSIDPIISYFTASPLTIKLGEKSTLSWKVDNCTSVEIDGGVGKVSPTGTVEVSPLETTTYTLLAMNLVNDEFTEILGAGSDEKLCTITVEK